MTTKKTDTPLKADCPSAPCSRSSTPETDNRHALLLPFDASYKYKEMRFHGEKMEKQRNEYAMRFAVRCDSSPSEIVGYRLQDGVDKAELYFLPGRPAQKTLGQMAELVKSGWMVTGIIYSENAKVSYHADKSGGAHGKDTNDK